MNSIFSPALIILLKWTVLLALGWVTHWLLRKRHSCGRLILWRSILCFGVAVPMTHFAPIPLFRIPIYGASVSSTVLPDGLSPVATSHPVLLDQTTATVPAKLLDADSAPKSLHPAQSQAAAKAISWKSLLALICGLGAIFAGLRLVRLQLQLGRLRQESRPASSVLQEQARLIQAKLEVPRMIDIRVSDAVASPFVCGLFRHAIMLPQKLVQELPSDEISALLAHEIAHFRRHDLFWCVGWRWMQALFWFHPLVWSIPAAHNLACEEEADRIASGQLQDPDFYPQLLARLALRVLALPAVETRLALNGISRIAHRLRHLQEGKSGDWNWKQSAAGFSLAGALFLLATGCEFSKATPGAPAQEEGKSEAKVSSGNSTSTASSSHVIKIKALIDGADTVKIQGNKVWYEHESWDLPGKWQGADEDTLINNKPWHPAWHNFIDQSKPYGDLQPAFAPKSSADIKLNKLAGRGAVEIAELPSAENHQTLAIRIDDAPFGGADWYELAIEWNNDNETNVIKIKALIDGADTVKIQGNQVWYEHESWELPGKWQGADENTLINDKPWHPEWPGEASNSKSSDPYLGLQPAFTPKIPANIKLTKIAGRGEVEISQLPTTNNHETLSFHLDDGPFGGADWYEVTIEWQ